MSEERKPKVDDIVKIGISKFELGPNDILAIICPEQWNLGQVKMFQDYYQPTLEALNVKAMIFPYGFEFHVVSRDEI